MQQVPRSTQAAHAARRRVWPRRAIVVGGDSVVTRALQVYLRKEGWDAGTVSDDLASWGNELATRPGATIVPFTAASVIILAPVIAGQRRIELCRQLRADPRFGVLPIIALRDAGDDIVSAAGALGGAVVRLAGTGADPLMEYVDASVAWPFRLREVLGTVDALIERGPRAA
jgi:hypothetical protein